MLRHPFDCGLRSGFKAKPLADEWGRYWVYIETAGVVAGRAKTAEPLPCGDAGTARQSTAWSMTRAVLGTRCVTTLTITWNAFEADLIDSKCAWCSHSGRRTRELF